MSQASSESAARKCPGLLGSVAANLCRPLMWIHTCCAVCLDWSEDQWLRFEGKGKYRRKSSVSPSPLPSPPTGPPFAAKVDMLERSVDSLKGGMQQILAPLTASFPANSDVGGSNDDHGDRPATTETCDFYPGRTTVEGEQQGEDRLSVDFFVVSDDLPMGQRTVPQSGGQSVLCASTPLAACGCSCESSF